jgi:hypothetical protein
MDRRLREIERVMLGVSMSLAGAVWIVRASVVSRRERAEAAVLAAR